MLIDLQPREGVDTSLEAFERVRDHLTQLELAVLVLVHAYLDATGHDDVTGGELAQFSGRSILALRPRMTGCVKKGWCEKGPARESRVEGELRCRGIRPVLSLAAVARAHEKEEQRRSA